MTAGALRAELPGAQGPVACCTDLPILAPAGRRQSTVARKVPGGEHRDDKAAGSTLEKCLHASVCY